MCFCIETGLNRTFLGIWERLTQSLSWMKTVDLLLLPMTSRWGFGNGTFPLIWSILRTLRCTVCQLSLPVLMVLYYSFLLIIDGNKWLLQENGWRAKVWTTKSLYSPPWTDLNWTGKRHLLVSFSCTVQITWKLTETWYRSYGGWVCLPIRLLPGYVLLSVGRRGRKMLHLGLEND